MPPLSGFLGKLLVLDALREPGVIGWAWTAILAGSLLTIVGFARAGSVLFWKSTSVAAPPPDGDAQVMPATTMQVAPVMLTLAVLGMLAIFAGPVSAYLGETSAQLFDRAGYIDAVLSPVDGDAHAEAPAQAHGAVEEDH
jgi:multicomponent K+:H+ antiporter subunit D